MIKILFCDDSNEQHRLINYYMKKFIADSHIQLEWQNVLSGKILVDKLDTALGVKELRAYSLFVLDVEMPEVDGILLAHRIRDAFNDVPIVYITGFKEYAYDAFGVTALDYLLKPITYDHFKKMMIKAVHFVEYQREKESESLKFQTKTTSYTIPCNHIYYLEKMLRKVRVVHINGVLEVYLSNKEVEEMLKPYDFIRCHQSYYVNLDKVSYYQNQSLYINKINTFLPVSKAYIKAVKNAIYLEELR